VQKDIRSLLDLEREDFHLLFKLAADLKKREKAGIFDAVLAGKVVGLLFDKQSTRTRVSFEAAMCKLGGSIIYMSSKDMQIARAEPVKDTARVLSRYIDGLVIRTYAQKVIEEYGSYATIPVINALSDLYHPCQILSDLLTIIEHRNGLDGLKLAWVGDGNNVAHSWLNAAATLDFDLTLACPEGYLPDEDILARARSVGGKRITVVTDPMEAVKDANIIYTDVWASMGQEDEQQKRIKEFEAFQVNQTLVNGAADDVLVMHCLPAHRGEEITDNVLEGDKSIVWDQAENKMHMHKAILKTLIG
jgi:ornithine carbamoyltransferase